MIDGPRIRVGVTGHRALETNKEARLARQVCGVLGRIRRLVLRLGLGTPSFTAVSLLAEGADRLVAREVLKTNQGTLEVLLPLTEEEYVRDFRGRESQREFRGLLARASRIVPPSWTCERPEAYRQAGITLLDSSHALIAIWNGESSGDHQGASLKGGTAEMVHMARSRAMPLFWIHANGQAGITEEHHERMLDRLGLNAR